MNTIGKKDFIFGSRPVLEAIYSDKNIDKILIKKGLKNETFFQLFSEIKKNNIPFQFVPEEKINKITRKNHQGIIALLSPIEFQNIENILPIIYEKGKDPLLLILDQVTDVRNLGAIVRTAECAGVDAVIIPEKGSARINADTVKTSAGAIFKIPVCRSKNLLETINYLKNSGIKILAASEKAEQSYFDVNMKIPLALISGSEEKGISPKLLENSDFQLKIPVTGTIKSLNVSVACSILIYEAIRQRSNP